MKEVSLKEDLSLDTVILHKLAEKTDCDIRSCLSSMQFMKSYKGRNADTESQDLFQQIAKKDKNKGIFAVWNDIFNLPQMYVQNMIVFLMTNLFSPKPRELLRTRR